MYRTLFVFIFLSASSQDVFPPDIHTTTPSIVSTTEHSWITPLDCPTNCTCKLLNSEHDCSSCGFDHGYGRSGNCHSHHWLNRVRYRRSMKIGRCFSEYNYHRGNCVKIEDHIVITCSFPQKELLCCKLNGPEECRDTEKRLDCTHNSYTYCGKLCEKGKDITASEVLSVLERNLGRQLSGNYLASL